MFSSPKLRVLLIVLAFIFIGLFIWLAGPFFGFGDYRPWAAVTARLVTLVLVLGGLAGLGLAAREALGRPVRRATS